jgi:hypothetical protein
LVLSTADLSWSHDAACLGPAPVEQGVVGSDGDRLVGRRKKRHDQTGEHRRDLLYRLRS